MLIVILTAVFIAIVLISKTIVHAKATTIRSIKMINVVIFRSSSSNGSSSSTGSRSSSSSGSGRGSGID